MLTESARLLSLQLHAIGAVRFGQFRLKLHDKKPDAPLSPIYIDLRILRSFPDVMDLAIEVYSSLINDLTFDCYADVPTAATPIVAILSHKTRIPMISPRIGEKGHGIRRRIDGAFQTGQVALLVDDLITLADSKLEAISVLEENGITVRDVVVLLDREQDGAAQLRKRGYRCHAALGLKDLLRLYLNSDRISREEFERTIRYLQASK